MMMMMMRSDFKYGNDFVLSDPVFMLFEVLNFIVLLLNKLLTRIWRQ